MTNKTLDDSLLWLF